MCTCTVNWFCVHLYSQLVLCTLLFVYTCTFSWFCVHLYRNWFFVHLHRNRFYDTCTVNWLYSYESNSRSAKGSVFAQSWHVASIKIKFKLSSSQELSKCLLRLTLNWDDLCKCINCTCNDSTFFISNLNIPKRIRDPTT